MPDIERQAVVDIVVNKDKAEQQYSDFIKKIEEPVKLEIDADVRDAVAAIKELQNMFKALTNQAKDGEKLRINVQGMAKLQQQLAQVDDTLSTLSNHFTGLRRSVDIQAELNDNQRALQSYQNSFKGVVDQINKLKTKRTTDNFFNMQKTKTNINDILSGASFKQVYEDSQQNVSRLLVEIAKAAQETDGLAKTIQLSETQSVSLADIFKAITTSIEASGKSLSDLKIEGLSADIIDVLKNIQKLESEIPTLQAKFDDAVNREKAGSINVQIDAKSIESLSEAISELKGVFKVEDGSTIGFKEEDIDRITSSFSELQTVLENIHNLLSSFDLPKIKAPEVETGEEKPRRESRSTTTVSTTMPTINGGTRTVINTSDSSTSTGGVSGIEAAVDGQNRLQQELRETRQEAESTQDALQEVGKQKSPTALDKKVAELQYLHDKVRTIFDGRDGIINEDMSYSEKFDSTEVQRMITLLSQLSDAELKATMGIDGEEWANEFRYNLQGEINAIKELQDEIQRVRDSSSGINEAGLDTGELDIIINDRLEHIYEIAQNVARSFDSSLTPSVKEFLSLIEDNLGISSMSDFMMGNAKEIDRYINDIIHNGKSVKEVFADMGNRYGWDTARFDNLIDQNVPTELKGLYDSLFSDVENRIKSAEQAAEEFNEKLREFKSTESPISSDGTNQIKADAKNVINLLQQIIALRQRIEQYRSLSGEEKNNYGSALRKTYGTDNIVELLEKQRSLQNDLVNLGKGVNAQTITEKSDGLFDDFTKIVDAASTTKDLLSSNLDSSSLLNVVSEICDAFGINIPEAVEKAKLTIQDGFSNALKESSSGEWKNGLSESEIQSVNKFVEARMAFGESQSKAISNALQIISSLKFDNIENISDFINKADDSVKRLALDITESKHGLAEIYEGKNESATFNPSENIKNDIKEYRKKIQEEFQSNEASISSGITTLPEQEKAAGQAGRQMGEQIAHGMDQATESVNTYREALNKSFATKNKRDATSQLRTAFNEYQKYFGKDGSEADKITRDLSDNARVAAYNYSEAYKEALKVGISETNLSKYRISDFGKYTSAEDVDDAFSDVRTYIQEQARILEELGNPMLSKEGLVALNEYMEQWDLLRKRQSDDNDFYMEDGVLNQSLLQADINYLQILKESLENIVKLSNEVPNETPVSEPETHPEEFEREASAAAEDREEIEKLNNEKRESPEPQSDSAEIEKQGEAYREATADAEKFAEAKRETSGETPSSTAVSESFQREAEAVREAMTVEEQALDKLKQKLIGEIPNAVDTKTQAFRSEQVEVDNLIDLEIRKIEELAKVLQSLFKGDSDSGIMSGLKDLFDSINKVKINKDTVQNLTDASWAIDTIGESFKKLSNDGLNSSAFDSLNDLLKKGEELKSLAKILDASEKKIATAGKAAGAGTTGKTTANPTKDATAEYKELLETIQAATKAKTELNKIETKQVNGKTVDAQLADATSKSTGASKAAADAMARIDEMYKDGVISVEQYTAAQKALQDSLKGTAESVDALATAQKNAVQRQLKSDTQTQIEIYRKESEEYKKLYRMQNSGGISSQDATRMSDLERYMTDQQAEWNAKIAQGADFIQRMIGGLKTVAQLQADVSQEFSDKWTKGLNNQLETMEKQSSWRKGNWKDIIEKLRREATVFKENIGTRGFKENQKEFDTLIGKMKAAMKSEDFLPIRETWQSSFTAKIETWANQNKIAAKEFGEQLETLKGQIAGVSSQAEATDLENIFSGIQSDAASKNLLGKSLGDRFKDQFKNTMTSLATYYLSFQDFIRYGREAISVVTELDTQLTEMRKVSNESLQTLQQYQLESFDIADRVGTTASQIQSSTADWMRLGEDLQEAKKSAEQSTLLLNVSEFTDIGDATKALTAMSQAYTELEKSEIIDKLNNIGNNFSISTSELAESLQKSAGTLKVTGDSLDEAIALTVAGNQVLQNPDIVGQSLKTISLRLSGTSVKDMQEAGEEIDGLITTQSKLRQVIMDATKVASNNYKGFDILNDDGSYKTTYERLLGIAEVFKEIGEEDKKLGTNRQSFLLETIANGLLWYVEIHMRNIFNCR